MAYIKKKLLIAFAKAIGEPDRVHRAHLIVRTRGYPLEDP